MVKNTPEKLIFVYNANSGLRHQLLDGAHKILSPNTYTCSLCAITFGAFLEKRVWKRFRKASNLKMEFLHKDEFMKMYKSKFGYKFNFPIILAEAGHTLEVLITTDELNGMPDAKTLIELIQERV
ncbi:MAG: GTPase [Bacteroidota bacterium]